MELAKPSTGNEVRSSQSLESVTLDFEAFEALPDARIGSAGTKWTDEMDDALRKYWKVKRQSDVAKLLGVSEDTARKRYRELSCQASR